MTFQEYLHERRPRLDAKGDFMRLARSDTSLLAASTWPEISAHMAGKGISAPVLEAGRQLWLDYCKALARVQSHEAAQGD